MILEENLNKRRRNLRLKYYALLGAIFLSLTGIFYLTVISQLFHFKEIVLESGSSVSEQEIRFLLMAKAYQTSWGRFLGYTNFLLWNDGEIEVPGDQISKLHLTRELSGGILRIVPVEREHRLIWCVAENTCVWVDGLGLAGSDAPFVDGQLVDEVWGNGDFTPRGSQILPPEQFKRLLDILAIIHRQNIIISRLEVNKSTGDTTARTLAGAVIYFSLRNDVAFAESVLADLQKNRAMLRYIDLRIENRAYYQ